MGEEARQARRLARDPQPTCLPTRNAARTVAYDAGEGGDLQHVRERVEFAQRAARVWHFSSQLIRGVSVAKAAFLVGSA